MGNLIDVLERIDDEIQMEQDEAKEILEEAGIDPKASLERLLAKFNSCCGKPLDPSRDSDELVCEECGRRVGYLDAVAAASGCDK